MDFTQMENFKQYFNLKSKFYKHYSFIKDEKYAKLKIIPITKTTRAPIAKYEEWPDVEITEENYTESLPTSQTLAISIPVWLLVIDYDGSEVNAKGKAEYTSIIQFTNDVNMKAAGHPMIDHNKKYFNPKRTILSRSWEEKGSCHYYFLLRPNIVKLLLKKKIRYIKSEVDSKRKYHNVEFKRAGGSVTIPEFNNNYLFAQADKLASVDFMPKALEKFIFEVSPKRKKGKSKTVSRKLKKDVPITKAVEKEEELEEEQYSEATIKFIKKYINVIDPNVERDVWIRVGMALTYWDKKEGLEIWDSWSKGSIEKYKEGETERQAASFKHESGGDLFRLPSVLKLIFVCHPKLKSVYSRYLRMIESKKNITTFPDLTIVSRETHKNTVILHETKPRNNISNEIQQHNISNEKLFDFDLNRPSDLDYFYFKKAESRLVNNLKVVKLYDDDEREKGICKSVALNDNWLSAVQKEIRKMNNDFEPMPKCQIEFISRLRQFEIQAELEEGALDWVRNYILIKDVNKFYEIRSGILMNRGVIDLSPRSKIPYINKKKKPKPCDFLSTFGLAQEVTKLVCIPSNKQKFITDRKGNVTYNTFERERPTKKVDLEKEDIENIEFLFSHFIRLCGNEEKAKIAWYYIARIIQNPGVPIRWFILITSKAQGVGKTATFTKIFKNLLGEDNISTVTGDAIKDKYTPWSNSCVAIMEDISISHKESKDVANKMKPYFSDDRVLSRSMYNNSKFQKNITNFIAFTNDANGWYLEKDDRRCCVIRSNIINREDIAKGTGLNYKEYNVKIYDTLLENEEFLNKLNFYFYYIVIPKEYMVATAPMTVDKQLSIDLENEAKAGLTELINILEVGSIYFNTDVILLSKLVDKMKQICTDKTNYTSRYIMNLLQHIGYLKKVNHSEGRDNRIIINKQKFTIWYRADLSELELKVAIRKLRKTLRLKESKSKVIKFPEHEDSE